MDDPSRLRTLIAIVVGACGCFLLVLSVATALGFLGRSGEVPTSAWLIPASGAAAGILLLLAWRRYRPRPPAIRLVRREITEDRSDAER